MLPTSREVAWALAGNVVIAVGAGTATLAAFAPSQPVGPDTFATRTLVIALGYAMFFAGYHISQAGLYRDRTQSLVASLVPAPLTPSTAGTANPFVAVRGLFILLGVLGLGAGLRLFAMTIESWDPTLGLLAGVVSIVGYICGHIGINWVLI